MSLKHILLGLLRTPTSGYDLKREFDDSLSHFWAAELSQIYPTLKQLEADGLVASRDAAPDQGPARVLYKRTAKGAAELSAWLKAGPALRASRHTDLAQMYFLDALDEDATRAFLESMLAERRKDLAALNAIADAWRKSSKGAFPDALPQEEFFPYLTLEAGLAVAQVRVTWCEGALKRVRRRQAR